ncbi:hypothetical protein SCMU_21940 [Sinomonas cyclohexanicum]|uniref:Uncharacterized protein n=1 Tax=Sinomonas cyclohexanicum TaxID=322009 RepID=A0ABN6FHJ2_SINCY|nr:hypothetical protein SCMU_21940 [Corynebacterium cyclohexanicum]
MEDLFGSLGGGSGEFDDDGESAPSSGMGERAAKAARDAQRSPLAVRMRPRSLDDVVGQQHLLGEGSPLPPLAAGAAAGHCLGDRA